MLQLKNIEKKYKNSIDKEFCLKKIDLLFDDNTLYFIHGKSGSGKSTLLNIISTIDTPDSGEMFFDNLNITSLNDSQKSEFRNENIGFVFQDYKLFEELSVYDNVAYTLELLNIKNKKALISEALRNVGLNGYEKKKVLNLSGGEKQRVAIARAMVKKPKILLCDEPTGSLDKGNSKLIFELLKSISNSCTVIVVTHDEKMSFGFSDKTLNLEDGEIISSSFGKQIQKKQKNETYSSNFRHKIPKKFLIGYSLKKIFKKPLRFILSSILTSLAIATSGITLSLNKGVEEKKIFETCIQNKTPYFSLSKNNYFGDSSGNVYQFNTNFSKNDEINAFANFPKSIFVYQTLNKVNQTLIDSKGQENTTLNGIIELNYDKLNLLNFKIEGRLPTNDNEIAVTKYFASCLWEKGYFDGETKTRLRNFNDIFNKKIDLSSETYFNSYSFTVVGIVDTNIGDKYEASQIGLLSEKEKQHLDCVLKTELHNCCFVNEGFLSRNFSELKEREIKNCNITISFQNTGWGCSSLKKIQNYENLFLGLDSNEPNVLIPFSALIENKHIATTDCIHEIEEEFGISYQTYVSNDIESIFKTFLTALKNEKSTEITLKEFEKQITLRIGSFVDFKNSKIFERKVNVCGISFDESRTLYGDQKTFDLVYDFLGASIFDCERIILPFTSVNDGLSLLKDLKTYKILEKEEAGAFDQQYLYSSFCFDNEAFAVYSNNAYFAEETKTPLIVFDAIFIAVSIALIVFYLYGVIGDSLKNFGIMKCLGSNKKDIVFAAFLFALIFEITNVLLSNILCFTTSAIINELVFNKALYGMGAINIDFSIMLLMIFISILTSLISFLLCIKKVNDASPIEAVRHNE